MKIAQVSFAETAGGAERVATDLHDGFLQAGHDAVLLTPRPDAASRRAGVIPIDLESGRGIVERTLRRIDRRLARPLSASRRRRGFDDPHHPWTARLLDALPWSAEATDILHLHNLHGGWFDLRQLGPLARRVPTVLTLHDAWLPLGGPHWPMHVDGWDADALAANHALRETAFADTPLTVVAPSRWMKGVWDRSPWSLRCGEAVVIPNGIDLGRFRVDDDRNAGDLDLVRGCGVVVLSVGLSGRGWPRHTEPERVFDVVKLLSDGPEPACVLNVGVPIEIPGNGMELGACRLVQPGRVADRSRLAEMYRVADFLFHAVKEDNCPLTVLEALACGTPVVAPRVGGIPELVRDREHGRVYAPDDDAERVMALRAALEDRAAAQAWGRNAAEHARRHFDRRRMAEDYLALYAELIGARAR
ncbi:MAG: glycosyltransferase [Planctomycetota bacterium]